SLVEKSADVERAVFDQHAVRSAVQRILKNAVGGRPSGPRDTIPFGKRARANTTHIGESAADVNVRAENADAAHAAFATSAQSRPGRAVPFGDAVGGYTAGNGKASAHIKVVPLKGERRNAVVHAVSRTG